MKYAMRRAEREITEPSEIATILKNCRVLRLAIPTETYPYVVPVNYGFIQENDRFTLYFHSAKAGRKVDLLDVPEGRKVGFETDRVVEIGSNGAGPSPCRWSCWFESVVGEGVVTKVEGDEKKKGLDAIMKHYDFQGALEYDQKSYDLAYAFKIEVSALSAKKH